MVNFETGCVIDILESRDMEAVCTWLKTFPNLKNVTRDGSQTYATAISNAFPNVRQIGDRFHILKNLNDAIILKFYTLFKERVSIPITPETSALKRTILSAPSMPERIKLVKKLYNEGRTQIEIKSITNFSSATIKKYIYRLKMKKFQRHIVRLEEDNMKQEYKS